MRSGKCNPEIRLNKNADYTSDTMPSSSMPEPTDTMKQSDTKQTDMPGSTNMPEPANMLQKGMSGNTSSIGQEMPGADMGVTEPPGSYKQLDGEPTGGMPKIGMEGGSGERGEWFLIELRSDRGSVNKSNAQSADLPGVQVDLEFAPISVKGRGDQKGLGAAGSAEDTVVVRATIDPDRRNEVEADARVVRVWSDSKIAPFSSVAPERQIQTDGAGLTLQNRKATCPIGTCDCSPGTPKGTISDVANYLGVDDIWDSGTRGQGIVVGIVDGGIRAQGRNIVQNEQGRPLLNRVIGGWPVASWGTTAAKWSDHGMMCGTDVLGMAPEAQIYDLRIADGNFLSDALSAFQWAIDRFRTDGTPQVLSNSWGIYQESWASDYATNPDHVFTRKVVEAIEEGIIVLFAAGNCGNTCPDGRCGSDTGPSRSIWGANGHERVITVGAVNKDEQFVGYSSQGPAALYANKPDFCSVTHFTGYFNSDSGTSAATPIAAGVVALLKEADPRLKQDRAQAVLKSTAKTLDQRVLTGTQVLEYYVPNLPMTM